MLQGCIGRRDKQTHFGCAAAMSTWWNISVDGTQCDVDLAADRPASRRAECVTVPGSQCCIISVRGVPLPGEVHYVQATESNLCILAVTRENHGCVLLCKIDYVYCRLALPSTNK